MFRDQDGNAANFAQNLFRKIGEPQSGQKPSPKQRFFSTLAKPENFTQFQQVAQLSKNKELTMDEGGAIHSYAAFIYALRTTEGGKKFIADQNFDIFNAQESQWETALNLLFTNESVQNDFLRNTERHMQTTFSRLALPVRLLLNKLFEGRRDIEGYDFGCGPHIDLPAIASDYMPTSYEFPDNDIRKYNKPVLIAKGIGLDLNPTDVEWVKACTSAQVSTAEETAEIDRELDYLVSLRTAEPSKFPIMSGDLFQFNPTDPVDFVMTKKMRYQYKEEEQDLIKQAINRTLKDGGYWVTIGEEEFYPGGWGEYFKKTEDEFWVYQKRDGNLLRITDRPLIEVSRQSGNISSFDAGFFGINL